MGLDINFEVFKVKENLFEVKTSHIKYESYNRENVTTDKLYETMKSIVEILNNKHNVGVTFTIA